MDIADILPKKKEKVTKDYYWALAVEPGWVQAGIWSITDGKAEVHAVSPPSAWETDEELITSSDTVLSSAVQDIPEEAGEPSKTVFGVPSSWVKEGQIQNEYLSKIKTVCSKLSLEPVGFVVLSEAISHYAKAEEGSPLSACVIGVSPKNVEVSVFSIGNLIGTSIVSRSVSVADDIAEGLSRFSTGEPLPSRFVLYDGKEGELEEVRQALMGANWGDYEKVKFLHTPKIELVSPEKRYWQQHLLEDLRLQTPHLFKNLEKTKKRKLQRKMLMPRRLQQVLPVLLLEKTLPKKRRKVKFLPEKLKKKLCMKLWKVQSLKKLKNPSEKSKLELREKNTQMLASLKGQVLLVE